jgi:hypothetical protein
LAALNLAYALTDSAASTQPPAAARESQQQLDELVKRIDSALETDGQLL